MARETAVIVGAGPGLSASLARLFAREGMNVVLAARGADKLKALADQTGARAHACDATDEAQVEALFGHVDSEFGAPEIVVYNAGGRYRSPIEAMDAERALADILSNAFGGLLVAREAAKRMLPRGRGSILLTGATASVKGYPQSTSFAMGKFALRGMAQSLARELAPKNVHVAHFIIDGGIASDRAGRVQDTPADRWLDPDAIAETYLQIHRQHRSAWTWEIELRPWVETF